ncbi:MAG: outer membrane lipoprotein carrier protein LolA [Fibromonadales bacterium]|nr:outer membrane lipoprotein carrier protein LolA [Fibromonadales bacterium]
MQIHRIIALLLMFFTPVVFGQEISTERQIWEKLQKRMEQGIKGDFRLTKKAAKIPKELISQGNFSISQKDGVIWETEKPFPDKNVFTMDKLNEYFSGNFDELAKKFDLKLERDGLMDKLTLIPKEKSIKKMIASVTMLVNENNLQNCKIIWANGDYAFYEFMVP